MFARILLFLIVFACLPLVPFEARAVDTDSVIKGSGDAVYYFADDGQRYVFPNAPIYFSWFDSFDELENVTDDFLATLPLAGAVTYRPGTRLVKLTTPEVYAVEDGGVLRWVTSESLARSLWGDAWASRVDDLSDAFFPHYLVGAPIDKAVYPDGAVFAYAADGPRYVMAQGLRREITGEAMFANHFRESDVALAGDALLIVHEGVDVTAAESRFTDAAELHGAIRQSTPLELSAALLKQSMLIQGEDDNRLFAFAFTATEAAELESVSVSLTADTSGDADEDAGGLVNGEMGGVNYRNMRILDSSSQEVFDGASLFASEDGDDRQTLTLEGSAELVPGTNLFFLALDVDEATPLGELVHVVLHGAEFVVDGESLGETFSDLESNALEVTSGQLTFALSGSLSSQTVVPGAGTIDVVTFDLEKTGNERVTIEEITLTGYLDEGEGDEDFVPGADEDNGAFTFLNDVLERVELVDDAGTVWGRVEEIPSDGRMTFADLFQTVEPGETRTLTVAATLSAEAPFELGADRFSFDISSADDVVLSESDAEIDGLPANGGVSPTIFVTVSEHGSLSLEMSGGSGAVVFGETDRSLLTLTFEADDVEDFVVEELSFNAFGSTTRSVDHYELTFTDPDGVLQTASVATRDNQIIFSDLAIHVPQDDDTTVLFRFDAAGGATGAVSGDMFSFAIDEDGPFRATGVASGESFDDLMDDLTVMTESSGTFEIRKNRPVVSAPTALPTPAGAGIAVDDVLAFNVFAEGEGSTRITKLTFAITPSDVGEIESNVASDNDLLEYLADVDGDFAADNDIVELFDVDTGVVYGEGANGNIAYAIFDDSTDTLDETPAGFDTARGDYGLITFEFATPMTVGNTPKTIMLELDLRGFDEEGGTLEIDLLGGDDFSWEDGDYPFEENGDDVSGIPRDELISVTP